MKIIINNTSKLSADTVVDITQLLSRFADIREGLIWLHLYSIANEKGEVTSSIYAIANALKIHRQTLSRIIKHLTLAGWVTVEESENHTTATSTVTDDVTSTLTDDVTSAVTDDVTDGVTDDVTDDVTFSDTERASKTHCFSSGCKLDRKEGVTLPVTFTVTSHVTLPVTNKEEKKQKKKNLPLHPLKKKKTKKRKNNTHKRACMREKTEISRFPCLANWMNACMHCATCLRGYSQKARGVVKQKDDFFEKWHPYSNYFFNFAITLRQASLPLSKKLHCGISDTVRFVFGCLNYHIQISIKDKRRGDAYGCVYHTQPECAGGLCPQAHFWVYCIYSRGYQICSSNREGCGRPKQRNGQHEIPSFFLHCGKQGKVKPSDVWVSVRPFFGHTSSSPYTDAPKHG